MMSNMEYCFVFGAPRSGATFLINVLSKLRDTVGKTGHLIPVAVPHIACEDISTSVYRALATSIRQNIEGYLSSSYHGRCKALKWWMDAPEQYDRLHHVFRSGPRPRPGRFIYKEPFLGLCPELIVEAIPEARLIHIYRDGRDVANSLVSTYDALTDEKLTHLREAEMLFGRAYDDRYVPSWVDPDSDEAFIESSPYVRSIWLWKTIVDRCWGFLAENEGEYECLDLRYERLVQSPRKVGNELLSFFECDETRAFRRKLATARESSIGKHARRSREEVERAEQVAEGLLSRLGYT